jgi:cyclic pyranopterin phosphate synthase
MESFVAADVLRLSITDKCNYDCAYCTPSQKKKQLAHADILRYEEISEIVQVFSKYGIKRVRITGGEPMIKKGLITLIKGLKSIDGLEELTLTTNGSRLLKNTLALKEAGIDRINISLNSLNKETFKYITGRDDFANVWQGIKEAQDTFKLVKLNVVLIKGINDNEMLDFVKLARDKSLSIRFIELFPTNNRFNAKDNYIAKDSILKTIEENLGPLIAIDNVQGNGPAEYFTLQDYGGSIGFINYWSAHFCNLCKRLRMNSIGEVYPCLFSKPISDLRMLIRNNDKHRLEEEVKKIILKKHLYQLKLAGNSVEMSDIGG